MPKPKDKFYKYRMKLVLQHGYRYACTKYLYVDPKDNKQKANSRQWGIVDENMKFIPNDAFRLLSKEERDKFIYPDDWDISEVNKISLPQQLNDIDIIGIADSTMLYGDIWLFNNIAEKTGMAKDLRKVFEDEAFMQDTLTLAYYKYLTQKSYNRVERWQSIEKAPSTHPLTPSYITRFTQSITEEHRSALIRLRLASVKDEDLLCIDSTTRSAYGGKRLCDIRFSRINKDDPQLACTNEIVVYSMATHMPVYYRTMQGNMTDISTFELIVKELRSLGIKNKFIFVTDRGYYTEQALKWCIANHQALITAAKCGNQIVRKHIEGLGPVDGVPAGMDIDPVERLYYKQFNEAYAVIDENGEKHECENLKVNLYFNPVFRGPDMMDIDIEISTQQQELAGMVAKELKPSDDELKKYRYFKIEKDENGTIVGFSNNESKIKNARMFSGFFALITHGVELDPIPALKIYRMRGEQELCFEICKDQLNSDKQGSWTEEGKAGRRFIDFVGMCLVSYARNIWRNTPQLYQEFDSTLEMFDEMRSIKWIEHKDSEILITPFIGDQQLIADSFGFEIPKQKQVLKKVKSRKIS